MALNEEIRLLLAGYNAPPEVIEQIASSISDIEESQVAPGLDIGDRAPDFELRNHAGAPVRLSDKLREGPAVVTFFRGAWCPICNLQIAALTRALPEIRAAGACVVGIHPDSVPMTPPEAVEGFDLAQDPDQQVIRNYRVQFHMPPALLEIYGDAFDVGLAERNADGSQDLPVPATFVLDRGGIVRERHVTADYTQRMEPEDVIAAVERF